MLTNQGQRIHDVLVLFGLCALAFSQPLFSLLSQYPEFFTSHQLSSEQLWIFTLVVSFVLPGFLSALVLLTGLFSLRLRAGLMILIIAVLSSVIATPFLNNLRFLPSVVILSVSVLIGGLVAWFYVQKPPLRSILSYLAIFSLLIPLSFIYSSGIRDIAFPEQLVLGEGDQEILPIPVVVVIFDEFTINSIVDVDGEIDEVIYPNLAFFANRAYWFENATTVADGTAYAVPAILSGQYAKRTQPTYQAYPTNIFTLLKATHTFNAHESASKLCPPDFCPPIEIRRSNQQQLALILIDSLVLYAHILLPTDLRHQLPDITQGWVNYLAPIDTAKTDYKKTSDQGWLLGLILSYLEDDRAALWHRFLDSIPNTPQPSLNLIHILLPHLALEYLPSGKNYGRQVVRGLYEEKWSDDEWAVKQAWQRHLLQLAYTDKLLGELFRTLEGEGLFDDALIIITADHGLSFKTGEMRRPISDQNYMDILPVPFFVKLPGQKQGHVSQLNVETVDILPTIVDVLNIPLPASLEGTSVFNEERLKNRKAKRLFTFHEGERTLQFPVNIKGRQPVINERIELFGSVDNPDKLYSLGTDKHWVGQFTDVQTTKPDQDYIVEMKDGVRARIYDKASGPNYVSGTLFKRKVNNIVGETMNGREYKVAPNETIRLALSVNSEVRAVTKTYLSEGDPEFAFMVPESAYGDDQNRVEIFRIVGGVPGELHRFVYEEATQYSVTYESGAIRSLVDESGNTFLIDEVSMMGFLDTIVESDHVFKFEGWAIDKNENQSANQVVLFVGGEFITSARPQYSRPDVAKAYQKPNFQSSGYRFYTEILDRQLLCKGEVEIFAVSEPGGGEQQLSSICLLQWKKWNIVVQNKLNEGGNIKVSVYAYS